MKIPERLRRWWRSATFEYPEDDWPWPEHRKTPLTDRIALRLGILYDGPCKCDHCEEERWG